MLRTLIFICAMALSACGGGEGASFAPGTGNTHCGVSVGTQRISGVVTSVHDGDTITVGGESVRLASIDAPELGQAYGPQSREDLAAMVWDQTVTVAYEEKDRYGRVVGTVFKTDCSHVNLKMVQEGAAWYYEAFQCEIDLRQRQDYAAAHGQAQAARRGLWAANAMAPWRYRNGVDAKVPNSCPNGDAASL
ncbi:thermonuclease family protein [Limnohabitans sp. Rim8]|uniref:thermonuclease family protein n=1 Tax=Limnohabitans sp. Rim8 TaxID=1100718 RepID=UPI0026292B7D|nr:thermonuclease family protein [Limnohabitans sp. Rim8]